MMVTSKLVIPLLFCVLLLNYLALHSAEVFAQNAETTPSAQVSNLPTVHILPDNPLYFLKTLKEKVQLLITRSASGQADLLLNFAQKRLAEALKVAEKGKIHISEKLFAAFGRDIKLAQEKIAEAKATGEQTRDLLVKLQETVAYQRAVLEKMQEEAASRSEEIQARMEALSEVLEATESGRMEARQPKEEKGLGIFDWLKSIFGGGKVLSPLGEP